MNRNLNKKNKKGGGIFNINETLAIKVEDSRIYKENDPSIYVINDNVISKNLQDLGAQINKYYEKNKELNKKL